MFDENPEFLDMTFTEAKEKLSSIGIAPSSSIFNQVRNKRKIAQKRSVVKDDGIDPEVANFDPPTASSASPSQDEVDLNFLDEPSLQSAQDRDLDSLIDQRLQPLQSDIESLTDLVRSMAMNQDDSEKGQKGKKKPVANKGNGIVMNPTQAMLLEFAAQRMVVPMPPSLIYGYHCFLKYGYTGEMADFLRVMIDDYFESRGINYYEEVLGWDQQQAQSPPPSQEDENLPLHLISVSA